jgi:hypothetical protein
VSGGLSRSPRKDLKAFFFKVVTNAPVPVVHLRHMKILKTF